MDGEKQIQIRAQEPGSSHGLMQFTQVGVWGHQEPHTCHPSPNIHQGRLTGRDIHILLESSLIEKILILWI